MSEPELIVIRCIRIDQFRRPMPEAETRSCAVCGATVWHDPALVPEIVAEMPDVTVVIHCRECVGDEEQGAELRTTPGQVRRLRDQGADDEEIAELFALGETAGPTGSIDAVRVEVATFPYGATAQRFREALDRTRVFVALTPR